MRRKQNPSLVSARRKQRHASPRETQAKSAFGLRVAEATSRNMGRTATVRVVCCAGCRTPKLSGPLSGQRVHATTARRVHCSDLFGVWGYSADGDFNLRMYADTDPSQPHREHRPPANPWAHCGYPYSQWEHSGHSDAICDDAAR